MRARRKTGSRFASHPLEGSCGICDKPLGSVPLLKRRRTWVHKACWMTEKGE